MRHYQHPWLSRSSEAHLNRRGSFAPAAMLALVVVVSAVALVLDKLWVDAAHGELETGVQAAALGAARVLANDDLLRPTSDSSARLEAARQAAIQVASKNHIAGQSIELDPAPDGSIRFGKLVARESDGQTVFVESTENPTTVVVTGEHSRANNNPVSLFWQGIGGINVADVMARAEASVDNHVVALRASRGISIPILPLAILKNDPDRKLPSWAQDIDQGLGGDKLSFDATTNRVIEVPDGIPEITLVGTKYRGDPAQANVHLFAISHASQTPDLLRHIRSGWSIEDFTTDVPEVRLDRGPLPLPVLPEMGGVVPEELSKLIGQCRIVLLYDQLIDGVAYGQQAVAGRILNVTLRPDGVCQMTFQPGVLTTRTAVLANETLVPLTAQRDANRYVYKLQLTF